MAPASEAEPARRLSPDARRQQFIEVAISLLAEQGIEGLDLDEIASRAGVTRNLIYHYFPGGRIDLLRVATEQVGTELASQWQTDPELPIEQRMEANFQRVIEHALEPSELWLAYRKGAAAGDPEVTAQQEQLRASLIAVIAQNHFGTAEPSPLAALALCSYVDFAERALDQCRENAVDRDQVIALLAGTLLEVAKTVRSLTGEGQR